MKYIILTIYLISTLTMFGQNSKQTKIELQEQKIAKAISDLDKMTDINDMHHINQVEGYKQGLWVESSRMEIWFIYYKDGLRDGKMTVYSTTDGTKHIEAYYKEGILVDSMIFYNINGTLMKKCLNIRPNDTIITREIDVSEGKTVYWEKQKHKFMYKADVKRYSSDGVLYEEGIGLFDDDKVFAEFKFGDWVEKNIGE